MFRAWFGMRGRGAARALAVLASLVLIVGVAGCGATESVGGDATATPKASATGGVLERACSGPDGSIGDIGTVNLELSTTSPLATGTPGAGGFEPYAGSAHVGDIIQVQVPTTSVWSLSTNSGGVELLSPSAVVDASHSVCFWNFKATAAGDTTLNCTGGALCSPALACPQYVWLASFVVHISSR